MARREKFFDMKVMMERIVVGQSGTCGVESAIVESEKKLFSKRVGIKVLC